MNKIEVSESVQIFDAKSSKTRVFHLGSVLPITKKGESAAFFRVAEAVCELGFLISILAEGDAESQKKCIELSAKYPSNFVILESTPRNREQVLNLCDAVILPAGADGRTLKSLARREVISILPEGFGLENFDPQAESGNAFTFKPGNFWSMVSAMVRASENFKFSYDWKCLKRNLAGFAK